LAWTAEVRNLSQAVRRVKSMGSICRASPRKFPGGTTWC
jgi:hypothetical protein